jgi:peroxiredoxin family protein
VPALAATGGSGFLLGKTRRGWLLDRKKKRMAIIGTNGLLVMIPAAIFLQNKAAAGDFDALFYTVQAVELIVGVTQLALMGMNFRDGLKLAGKM